jgi:hypothetical protein
VSSDGGATWLRSARRGLLIASGGGAVIALYWALASGRLTLDLKFGRRQQPLGPIDVAIAARRELVYGVITEPYLGRQTRAFAKKLKVLERADNLVIAEHRTDVSSRLVTSTLESVRFTPPERVDFRLLRGPVPAVTESITLEAMSDNQTLLHYKGTLETDLWQVGAAWGRLVARQWNAAVRTSVQSITTEAERRASHPTRHH